MPSTQSIPEPLRSYDWKEAFGYAAGYEAGEEDVANNRDIPTATPPGATVSVEPFTRRDVRRIIALQDGDSDGPDWVIVGELWDGRFFALRAGCDYSGWD